ncbi:hypothetical protein D3C80_1581160 [compost metagenome]
MLLRLLPLRTVAADAALTQTDAVIGQCGFKLRHGGFNRGTHAAVTGHKVQLRLVVFDFHADLDGTQIFRVQTQLSGLLSLTVEH